MSGAGATAGTAASGAASGGDPAGAGASRGLLLVLEPGGAETPAGAALLAEGARLAKRLGVAARAVTWSAATAGEAGAALAAATVAETLLPRVEALAPVAVLLVDSDAGREVAPLVAHRLGCGLVVACSDVVTDERGGLVFVKPVYGGWLEEELRAGEGATVVATLDLSGIDVPATGDMQAPSAQPPTVEALAIPAPGSGAEPRVRRLELLPPDAKSVDLVHAKRIVSAGMGTAGDDLLVMVQELADLLDGSVGATRPVVDEGRLPKERLIGQTGRTVTPDLYVALGISGSPHHVAGVRKAGKIVAVNRDPRAPIFQFSDVGYVADLQAVLPGLLNRIKRWRDAGE